MDLEKPSTLDTAIRRMDLKNSWITLSADILRQLGEIWDNTADPTHPWYGVEVGGALYCDENGTVTSQHCFGRGQEGEFEFLQFFPYTFHTHPLPPDSDIESTPPSGLDFVRTLAWGGIQNHVANEDGKLHSVCDVVVSWEGIWTYAASEMLKEFYDGLPTNEDREKLETILWFYVEVVGAMYCNEFLTLKEYMNRLAIVDVEFLNRNLNANPDFEKYVDEHLAEKHRSSVIRDLLKERADLIPNSCGFRVTFTNHAE